MTRLFRFASLSASESSVILLNIGGLEDSNDVRTSIIFGSCCAILSVRTKLSTLKAELCELLEDPLGSFISLKFGSFS